MLGQTGQNPAPFSAHPQPRGVTLPCSLAPGLPDDIATGKRRPRSLTWLRGVCKRRAWGAGEGPRGAGEGTPGPKMLQTWAISSATEEDENKIEAGLF